MGAMLEYILFGLLLLMGANVRAQEGYDEAISSLISLASGQMPNDENESSSQFKDKALNDTSNVEIYNSNAQQIIERSGYRQKTYQVVSDDGYITQLINLINPLVARSHLKQPPVVMFHGGLTDPTIWLFVDAIQHHPEKYPRNFREHGPITSSNRSLAFTLANNGHDVWLVGTRGSNKQNLGHVKYDAKLLPEFLDEILAGRVSLPKLASQFVDTIKYFDYSMDDLVEYEFPRQIEAVLGLTGSEKVSVVGVSFSTPILFKLLISNKSLAKRIHSYLAHLPLLNRKGTNKIVGAILDIIPNLPTPVGTLIVQLIFSKPVRDILRTFDRYTVYKLITTLVFGKSSQFTSDLSDSVVGHIFLSTGFKEAQHWAQQVNQGQLQRYDHGPANNVLAYGTLSPPVYDLAKFKLKRWMIISAENDILGTPDSTDQYVKQIRVKPYKVVKIAGYNHLDGIAAFDNDVKVNLPALEFFEKFQITDEE